MVRRSGHPLAPQRTLPVNARNASGAQTLRSLYYILVTGRSPADSANEDGLEITMEDNTLKLHDLLSQFPPAMQGAMSTQPFFDDIDAFWKAVYQGPHLSMRMKELIMIAFHGASSALNDSARA